MSLNVTPQEIVARAEESGAPGLLARAPGWPRVELGSLVRVVNGAAYPSRGFNVDGVGQPLIRIRDVGVNRPTTFFSGEWEDAHRVDRGDLLIGMDGDFRAARWSGPPALLNQRVCRVDVIDPRLHPQWLLHVIQGYLDAIWRETSSVTVKHLSSRSIASIPLPLPPLDEQRRIVDILEDHMSRLDAAAAILDTAARRAARLEQAFLELAAHHGDITPLGDVTEIQGGIQKQPKRDPRDNAYPFLRVANVTSTGLDLEEVHKIELFAGELERLRLRQGDLLVVEGNGSASQIGRAALWDGSIADCVHQNHLIRVRPGSELLPEYLEAVWNSPGNRGKLTRLASSSSGLYTLSVAKLKSLAIPVPTLELQQDLVAHVDAGRVAASRALASVDAAERRSGQLRRALLAAAFSGQLTARQPSRDGVMSRV